MTSKLKLNQADVHEAGERADETPATPGAALAATRLISAVGEILDAH